MYITPALIVAFLAPVCTVALATPKVIKRSAAAEVKDGKYIVDRQAEFANHVTWTFDGSSIPEGLGVSTYPVNDQRGFYAENAIVRNGYLELVQSAGPDFPYRGGEVVTSVKNIKYASVRTVAILTETYGTCNGMCSHQWESRL
jgi:hypothetical protein